MGFAVVYPHVVDHTLLNAMKAHRRMQGESQSTSNQEDSSMTFALIIVVIVFVMCQAPRLLWIVIQYLSEPFDMVWCYSFQILCTLILLSSVVNFFIYIVMNKRFRDVLTENGCSRNADIEYATVNMMATSVRVRETDDSSVATRL